jgi:phosphoribosyl 1,2-cyclic phosphate phosphodiesterase
MDGTLIVLGCGGSAGVPAIGNWWSKCDPTEPHNRRTRPSVALQTADTLVIVDTGPDFREQMNREQLGCPDHIIITHEHSDHVNGIDELRTLQRRHKRKFPIHMLEETSVRLIQRLDYMFADTENGFYPAVCEAAIVKPPERLNLGPFKIQTYEQDHGTISSLGLRIGNLAYSTDVKRLDDAAFDILRGVETWVVDGAGHDSRSNPVHASIEEVIEMNERIGALRVILTHLPPTMDYQTLRQTLPPYMEPAYDGMRLTFTF